MKENVRKIYIDYLRVAATIAVVFIHSTSGWYGQINTIDAVSWWMTNILNVTSRFAVPVFVMISGAVLLGGTMNADDFYRRRAMRLVPPILFWSVIYLLFRMYKGMDQEGLVRFLTIGIWSNGYAYIHLWYLSMFLCLMLFVPYINNFITGTKITQKGLTVLLSLSSLFFLLNTVSDLARETSNIFMYWHLLFQWYLVYFIAGYYFDKYGETFSARRNSLLFMILFCIAVGASVNFFLIKDYGIIKDYLFMNDKGIISFFLALSVFLLFKKYTPTFVPKQIVSVSKKSFGIYLIHPMILDILSTFLYKYSLPGYAHICLVSLLTFFVSYFFIFIMRKSVYLGKVC